MKKERWILGTIALAAFIGLILSSKGFFGKKRIERVSESRYLMAMDIQIDICRESEAQDLKPVFEKSWARLEDIAWRMNVYDDRSDVARVNSSFENPVTIGTDTWDVIQQSLEYNRLTEGAFDITVRPLIVFWKKTAKENRWPKPEELEKIRAVIGSNKVKLLPDSTVAVLHPDTRIDLGGIAAGYAVDEVAAIIRSFGIQNFYINASGDIYVGGINCEGEKWRIGVRDPKNKTQLIDVLALSNQGLTTSGNYEQYVEIEGQKFSHIINPITGYSQQGVISATVISNTTIEADALATAVCVLGAEPGLKIIETIHPDNAGMIIVDDPKGNTKIIKNTNYSKFQVEGK